MKSTGSLGSGLIPMDVLLLSQLLHVRSIENAAALDACDTEILATLYKEWEEHPSFAVYGRSPPPLNTKILRDIYPKLLAQYQATLTTALANTVYHIRLKELDDHIAECREEFKRVSREDV